MQFRLLLALVLTTNTAYAQQQSDNKDCATADWFNGAINLYQVCLAAYAKDYEKSGDAADTVATAVVGQCRPVENILAKDLTDCGRANGQQVTANLEGRFHEWAVQAVVQARAKRLGSENKSE